MDKITGNKPFIVANVREIIDQWDREEISYSRMVEMLNEIAFNYFTPSPDTKAAELEKELDSMTELKDYWYNRCYQAEFFIDKSPCDPDITQEQIEAYRLWEESKRNKPNK
jgi:hypothetical protein